MNNCCAPSVPQFDSGYETFGQPVADWRARLSASLSRRMQSKNQTMGDLSPISMPIQATRTMLAQSGDEALPGLETFWRDGR
jgi:hypothetical protein